MQHFQRKITIFGPSKTTIMAKSHEILGYKFVDVVQYLSHIGLNIILALVILIAGFWISNKLGNLVARLMKKQNAEEGLITFVSNLCTIASKVIVVTTAITQLGFEMTSFVTVLGAAGIAVGMAFSGTLSNFAGGILILAIKPFKVGDTITALTFTGEVDQIQIFNTYIITDDNKTIILPNGPLINGTIINSTKEGRRRVEITFPVPYGADMSGIKAKIDQDIKANDRVLLNEGYEVFFTKLEGDSGVLMVTCWVKTVDFELVEKQLNNAFFLWMDPLKA